MSAAANRVSQDQEIGLNRQNAPRTLKGSRCGATPPPLPVEAMSSSNSTAAASVLERYPDCWHIVVELCRRDEDFRELCDHYAECLQVRKRLEGQQDAAPTRLREYRDLIRELENEIEAIIRTSRTIASPVQSTIEGAKP